MKPDGYKYCSECGELIREKAEICPHCGCRQSYNTQSAPAKQDKWMISLLLCFFFGYLGAHRFYSGHILIGILQFITGGGCGIWLLIDLILILSGKYTDSEGNPIVNT
ncbi:MAG: hypothetical protein CL823_06865 [Crocinitomicaceae bacterium]|nr:hypothetical protein [Crocinitomicaceae bacterium]|tara:strand:+ start:7902 stop:8225 length:324 start_codon:yes stop_codon:yes gene_type:complete